MRPGNVMPGIKKITSNQFQTEEDKTGIKPNNKKHSQ